MNKENFSLATLVYTGSPDFVPVSEINLTISNQLNSHRFNKISQKAHLKPNKQAVNPNNRMQVKPQIL